MVKEKQLQQQQQQQQQLQKENQSKQTNKQIRIKRLRPCSYEPHNPANLPVFLVLASVKTLECTYTVTSYNNESFFQQICNKSRCLGSRCVPEL